MTWNCYIKWSPSVLKCLYISVIWYHLRMHGAPLNTSAIVVWCLVKHRDSLTFYEPESFQKDTCMITACHGGNVDCCVVYANLEMESHWVGTWLLQRLLQRQEWSSFVVKSHLRLMLTTRKLCERPWNILAMMIHRRVSMKCVT